MNNDQLINFLERAIYKNSKEIEKINGWVNEFGPLELEDHIKYRDFLIKRNQEIDKEIKQLINEMKGNKEHGTD